MKVEMKDNKIMNNKKRWSLTDQQELLLNKWMIRTLKSMIHLKQRKEVLFKEFFQERFFQKIKI